ncbi:DUF4166 domain-containing protein [Octadecabacter sp. G9-8]|uniref:DUF4166 domain-containing protein n=1 Tax=Octadecabacter dasysiphoniae TaxID=2909341 RepID=A0ABS9D1S5_9RHOB|nr:SDR family oxidoreductase [Octadecabacter dasysiphoniae]MCF2872595.1 DUF4166 domain-containing protein [Octadecabacter dasysiphoniae]
MKIMVIGGTGAFGARLCDLLWRDGHDVTIASRRKPTAGDPAGRGRVMRNGNKAPNLADFKHLKFDRDGPLTGFDTFDVIVDAAGPFHAYGTDPYRVPKAAIAAGAHYFDLCDNADFCQGINVLSRDAKVAGVCVYSGMSSVPAISSAVVDGLRGDARPLAIETAILPGNKAPRGRAVVESILDQTGRYYTEKQGGSDIDVRSWSDPKTYDFGGYRRQGWRIEVPDQRLFPDHFDCPNVSFRAGLELGVMRYGLGLLSYLRSKLDFGITDWFVSLMTFGARVLAPFGTDRGGMIVQIDLAQGNEVKRKSWIMRATNGDGPYTPAIAIRAACRDISSLPHGAGPALSLISLDKIEACFDDLNIETQITEAECIPMFRQVLGADMDRLPAAVKATHDAVTTRRFKGLARVTRGNGLQARVAAALFGFPPSADEIEVEVTKTPTPNGETWVRRFGRATFQSHLRARSSGMTERFGAMTFELDLQVQGGKLHFPVKRGRMWGIAIPRMLLPQSIATEAVIDGTFHFDVHLKAPTGATLIHYQGWLKPV